MENIYKQIDGIFKNGLINSGISIILSIIAILIINKIINKVLKKQIKDPLKLTLPMRIKRIVLIVLILAVIMSEIKAMESIIKALLAYTRTLVSASYTSATETTCAAMGISSPLRRQNSCRRHPLRAQ